MKKKKIDSLNRAVQKDLHALDKVTEYVSASVLFFMKSWNYRTIEQYELEGTFKDHLVQPPVPWAGISFTRSGCLKPCPIIAWVLSGQ